MLDSTQPTRTLMHPLHYRWMAACAIALSSTTTATARADEPEFRLVIQDHRFTPARTEVPAGQKLKLVVENRDPTPEEFESYALNREKIVPGQGRITVYVGPLKPGQYEFFGEFHMDTARGWLVAR